MPSTDPRPISPASSSQSKRSSSSSSELGLQSRGDPTLRSEIGTARVDSIGIQSTRDSFRRTREASHSTWPIADNGIVQTKVDSTGRPRESTGKVFSSIPRFSKSGCALEPADAPSARSSILPTQPLCLRSEVGVESPKSAAIWPSVRPARSRARSRSSRSVWGAVSALLAATVQEASGSSRK